MKWKNEKSSRPRGIIVHSLFKILMGLNIVIDLMFPIPFLEESGYNVIRTVWFACETNQAKLL